MTATSPSSIPASSTATPTNIATALAALTEPFCQYEIARVNESVVRIAWLDGEFPWHHHDEDELFLCWAGEIQLDLEGGKSLTLRPGDTYVIPRGVRHRPVTSARADVVLIERPETKQYGN